MNGSKGAGETVRIGAGVQHDRTAGPTLSVESDGVAWLVFDDPRRPVNVLDQDVLTTLAERVEDVREGVAQGEITALVVASGKEDSFVVGADVSAMEHIRSGSEAREISRFVQAVFMDLELLPVPTVAAVHGTCLGGGLELALACRYRLASDAESTRFSFPEVQLGILPAWGGTSRLPRLIGLQPALDLLLTGKSVDAPGARRRGLVETVLPTADFAARAGQFVRERVAKPTPTGARRPVWRRLAEDTAPGRRVILRAARKRVLERTGGHYPAPLTILDVLRRTLGGSVERSLEEEVDAIGVLVESPEFRSLLHVFHLREGARKGGDIPSGAEPRPVRSAVVVGAGVMGGGIGQLFAYNDIQVRLKDIEHDAVRTGLRHARSLFDRAVERRRLSRPEAVRKMDLISGGLQYEGLGTADLVVEAVVERMDVKRQVLGEVEEGLRDDAVLTTNTSALSVDAMAESLERPERFAGLHFFNPVHRMPLVEVVRGGATDDETTATLVRLVLDLGKVPVVVRDGPGFLVNRILGPYMNEAGHLLAEGCRVEEIDGAAKAFGMPMGPLRLVDEVGLDVARHAGGVLHEAFGERLEPAGPLVALSTTDRLGKKGGRGFYLYRKGKEEVDSSVYGELTQAGVRQEEEADGPPPEEIRDRLMLAKVNEAARALDEGIVPSAAQVDLALIMGTGFPPFRGGLLLWADRSHPALLVRRLQELEDEVGPRYRPAPVLEAMARDEAGFYERFPAPAPFRP